MRRQVASRDTDATQQVALLEVKQAGNEIWTKVRDALRSTLDAQASMWQRLITNGQFLHFAAALVICLLYFAHLHDYPLIATIDKMDWYFGADSPRVLENLRDSDDWDHGRDRLHPFFSILRSASPRFPALSAWQEWSF